MTRNHWHHSWPADDLMFMLVPTQCRAQFAKHFAASFALLWCGKLTRVSLLQIAYHPTRHLSIQNRIDEDSSAPTMVVHQFQVGIVEVLVLRQIPHVTLPLTIQRSGDIKLKH